MAQYILLFLLVNQQQIRFPHFRRVNVYRIYAAKVTSIPLKPIVCPMLYITDTVKLIGVHVHTSGLLNLYSHCQFRHIAGILFFYLSDHPSVCYVRPFVRPFCKLANTIFLKMNECTLRCYNPTRNYKAALYPSTFSCSEISTATLHSDNLSLTARQSASGTISYMYQHRSRYKFW